MLDGVSLDQLRTFIAAVDEGSFTAAGRRLRRAQSVVSQTLANLEGQLGVKLFDRSARRPGERAKGGACRGSDPRDAGRADHIRGQICAVGPPGRPRPPAAGVGSSAGRGWQALGRRRDLFEHRTRDRNRSMPGPRSGAGPGDPGDRAGPARRVPVRVRGGRFHGRADRDRDPPPGPDRGRRGGGTVRGGAEGLLGDAAQAQPRLVGASVRAGPGAARLPGRGARRRRAVARARHLAQLGRTDRAPRCHRPHPVSAAQGDRSGVRARGARGPGARQPDQSLARPRLQPVRAPGAGGRRLLARRRLPDRPARRPGSLGVEPALPRTRSTTSSTRTRGSPRCSRRRGRGAWWRRWTRSNRRAHDRGAGPHP